MNDIDIRLTRMLQRHEGFRGTPYRDTEGHLTIGYGRNLDARPLTEPEARYLLEHDLLRYESEIELDWPIIAGLDEVRYAAVLNMVYNLGTHGFMGFKKLRAALENQDWDRAADEALDSRWAKQVGRRAREIAYMLQSGKWADER